MPTLMACRLRPFVSHVVRVNLWGVSLSNPQAGSDPPRRQHRTVSRYTRPYPGGVGLAEEVGIEPNPRKQDLVFKASRRTVSAASSSIVWR